MKHRIFEANKNRVFNDYERIQLTMNFHRFNIDGFVKRRLLHNNHLFSTGYRLLGFHKN